MPFQVSMVKRKGDGFSRAMLCLVFSGTAELREEVGFVSQTAKSTLKNKGCLVMNLLPHGPNRRIGQDLMDENLHEPHHH